MKKSVHVQAPGRINLIGEHTDYSGGYVLPAAIDKCVQVSLSKNGTADSIKMVALDLMEDHECHLSTLKKVEAGWQNYVIGTIAEVNKVKAIPQGFELSFTGTVPMGSGMSSSAALECSIAFAINELFELGISKLELAKICQRAEHNYVGTKCGIMDQYASLMGKKNHAFLLDCQSLEHTYCPIDLGDCEILLLNTNVNHQLAESAYNDRRTELESALEIIKKKIDGVQSFRDVAYDQVKHLQKALGNLGYKRSKHVVLENRRVLDAAQALSQNDITTLGKLMYQSHESLSKDYEVSCAELDFLVDQTRSMEYVQGSKMMGGGFGGCTINVIQSTYKADIIATLRKAYTSQFDLELSPYTVHIENGAHLIHNS